MINSRQTFHWKAKLGIFTLSLLLTYAAHTSSILVAIDQIQQDLWHRLAGLRHSAEHVSLVVIDEETLYRFREDPLVFWSPHYAAAAKVLRQVGVTVIGIDLLLSISPEEWLRKHDISGGAIAGTYDIPLREEIAQGQVVLVASAGTTAQGKTEFMLPADGYLLAVPGFDLVAHIGLADLVSDLDGGVRQFYLNPPLNPEQTTEGMPNLSLAALMAIRATAQDPNQPPWQFAGRSMEKGPYRIGFGGPPGTIPRIPLKDLLASDALDNPMIKALQGKAVVIGGEYSGMNDVHVTPYTTAIFGTSGSYMTGAEIQANILESLLSGKLPTPLPKPGLLVFWITALSLAVLAIYALRPVPGLALLLVLWLISGLIAYLAFLHYFVVPIAALQLGLALVYLGTLGIKLSAEERERQRVTGIFGRYVSEDVVDQILASGDMPMLGGESRTMTVLFSDIRNFTMLSERLAADEVVEMLNTYFERICPLALENGGTIDKFIGDAIMLQFGAPVAHPDHADRAIRTALGIHREAVRFQSWLERRFPERNLPPFAVGIGLHSGEGVAGNIGSQARLEYTVIGDVVNAASRIEGKTKDLGVAILASQQAIDAALGRVVTGKQETVTVKGKEVQLTLYEILDIMELSP